MAGDIAGEVSNLEDKYLGELLTKRSEEKAAIARFREALETLPKLLSDVDAASGNGDRKAEPLVIIIDELDRCRPLFALNVLERIKHFFSVPGVHFVLGCHLGQLRKAVQVAYGAEIDAHTYLQKFIHFTVPLHQRARHAQEEAGAKYVRYLLQAMHFPNSNEIQYVANTLPDLAANKNYSLRSIERIMSILARSLAANNKIIQPTPILLGLCVLKTTNPDLYERARRGLIQPNDVRNAFGPAKDDQSNVNHMIDFWLMMVSPAINEEETRRVREMLFRYTTDRLNIVPIVANHVVEQFNSA